MFNVVNVEFLKKFRSNLETQRFDLLERIEELDTLIAVIDSKYPDLKSSENEK